MEVFTVLLAYPPAPIAKSPFFLFNGQYPFATALAEHIILSK